MKRLIVITIALAMCLCGSAGANVNSPYGINSHVPSSQLLDLIAQSGIGWVRVDMNWFQMEPGKDQYNWGFMDNVINGATARGLSVFATLAYTPGWANGTGNIGDPPTDIGDWSDFVFDTVNRYKSKVKYWGMWNEPNLEQFFTGTAWQYREWILKPGYNAAKAADSGCLVLGPELAHLSGADWPVWMEESMIAGGADHIDIITHHCYKGDNGWDAFEYLDEGAFHWLWDNPPLGDVLKDLGVSHKPVWLTEVGWYTADGDNPDSESDQAKFYHQLLWGVHERANIQKVFPYEAMDDPTAGVPKWGMINSSYVPKPAYYTFQSFIANPTDPGGGPTCGAASVNRTSGDPAMLLLLLAPLLVWGIRRKN
jgi:polysaccharide biosynthesis protein PslG